MERYYTKDLDHLIICRLEEFKYTRLKSFKTADIDVWNYFNEDIFILPFSEKYPLQVVQQEKHFNKAENHDIDFRIIYSKIYIDNQPYALVSRIPMIEKEDLIRTLTYQYGLLLLIMLTSLSIVFYLISKRLWHPFHATLSEIQRFKLEKGKLPQFESCKTSEFILLNQILTELFASNLSSYKKQKEFIENASHELQTPLAVFKTQLDMLLQEPNLSQKQIKIIQSLYSVSSRMTRLNKNLLLLARIDNKQFDHMESINFAEILQAQLIYLSELNANNNITIHVDIKNPTPVYANKILVESLITNLCVNAIRHNIEDGIIYIQLTNNCFSVSNTGANQPLDQKKAFSRFNRASEERKGNGLGLSIAQEICLMHNWQIQYRYNYNLHIFSVKIHN